MDSRLKMPHILRNTGASLLIVGLLALALTAWRWGLADIHAAGARSYIKSWWKGSKTPSDEEWEKVRSKLEKSLAYHPDFPLYVELLGTIHLTRSLNILLDDGETEQARSKAGNYFREVVTLRPSWPYAWANILWIKTQDEDYDDEFFHALDRSIALGSWESKVQHIVTDTSLSAWDKLDDARRRAALGTMKQTLHRNPKEIIELADFHGAMKTVCPLLAEDQRRKYCRDIP